MMAKKPYSFRLEDKQIEKLDEMAKHQEEFLKSNGIEQEINRTDIVSQLINEGYKKFKEKQ